MGHLIHSLQQRGNERGRPVTGFSGAEGRRQQRKLPVFIDSTFVNSFEDMLTRHFYRPTEMGWGG